MRRSLFARAVTAVCAVVASVGFAAGSAPPAQADSFYFGVNGGGGHRHGGYGYNYGYSGYRSYRPPDIYYPPPAVIYEPPPAVVVAPPPAVVYAPPRRQPGAADQMCREYQSSVVINGKKQPTYGTACLQPDGSWRIVN